jgi:hypothetical protein
MSTAGLEQLAAIGRGELPVEVRIVLTSTSRDGLVSYRFERLNGARIGYLDQVLPHVWRAWLAIEQRSVATAHASYELAEQALMQRAGLSASTIHYTEASNERIGQG